MKRKSWQHIVWIVLSVIIVATMLLLTIGPAAVAP